MREAAASLRAWTRCWAMRRASRSLPSPSSGIPGNPPHRSATHGQLVISVFCVAAVREPRLGSLKEIPGLKQGLSEPPQPPWWDFQHPPAQVSSHAVPGQPKAS